MVQWACAEADPYGAPRGANYVAEEVTVTTRSGLSLTGTLTLPKGSESALPAAVTITGSGSQDRDEHIRRVGDYRPFRQIADTLGARGIAVLRLDDRGVNGSDPGPPGATSADLAEDIRAAVEYLRARPEIDASRVALIGHSEGGVIAPMVAAEDSAIAAVVLLAGPAYTFHRVSETALEAVIARTPTLSEREAATMRQRALQVSEQQARDDPWYRAAFSYDPLPVIRAIRVPVLLLQGDTDTQITPEQADTLAAALREAGNADVTVARFPDTNHLFLQDSDGRAFRYDRLPSHEVRKDVLGTLADWLADRLH
jgi:dipeptidyl aminopeptidase/acylaminoacyl peptidase